MVSVLAQVCPIFSVSPLGPSQIILYQGHKNDHYEAKSNILSPSLKTLPWLLITCNIKFTFVISHKALRTYLCVFLLLPSSSSFFIFQSQQMSSVLEVITRPQHACTCLHLWSGIPFRACHHPPVAWAAPSLLSSPPASNLILPVFVD